MNIKNILQKLYGIETIDCKKMAGYDSINYAIKTVDNQKYVLKLHVSGSNLDFINAENEMMLWTAKSFEFESSVPHFSKNNLLLDVAENHHCRLLTFLEGEFLAETKKTTSLLTSFGIFLAKLVLSLKDFNHLAIKGEESKWDLQHVLMSEKYLNDITNPSRRKLAQYFYLQHRENVMPHVYDLRKQIIHGDANDWNVLVKEGQVSGIIDFGDACYSHLINDVAIAAAYIAFEQKDPIESIAHFVAAYHKVNPLEKLELELLYYLIANRLTVSVCNSAYSRKLNPENEYISVSEKFAWETLEKWISINPIKAKNSFLDAVEIPREKAVENQKILTKRNQFFSKAISLSYKEPIQMTRAAFQYMYDANGNTYLDAYNNIPLVGHSHPKVVNAVQRQMAKLNTNTRYLYPVMNEYAAQLLSKFPSKLNKLFLVNSGSAASDLAIRLATNFTGKNDVLVLEQGYHGNTRLGIDISAYKFDGKGGSGAKSNIHKLPLPNAYNGKFTGADAGNLYASEAVEILQNKKAMGADFAAFIAEPIVGCGGQMPLPNGYLSVVFDEMRKMGGLCIADEVQIGFGRLGSHFWGFEMLGVEPDIVIIGKPMGNAHPIAGVVTTSEIADAFANGMEFFSSFGGNPVSCAAGKAVLEVLEEEKLQNHALSVGNYFKDELKKLQFRYPQIGDVRGSGLFLGIDIVKDPVSKEANTELAHKIKNVLKENFVLVSTDGPYDNVIKTKPPLCFSKGNVDIVVTNLNKILNDCNL